MSVVAIKWQQQVEHVISRLVTHIQSKYPVITTEVTYDPPDKVDAWVTLHGAVDAAEWDEIRQFGCEITDPAWEHDGILVLIHGGDYPTPTNYAPLDQAAIEAAIKAYKSRQKADQMMARMVQEIQRVFPQLTVEAAAGGPECEDGWVTIHVPAMATPDAVDPRDVAHSLCDLVSDLAWDDGTDDGVPVHIHVTHELDAARDDPALTAALQRHYQLTEVLGRLYPLIDRSVSALDSETEVVYYPSAGVDTRLILHGVQAEAQMEAIRNDTRAVIEAARRESGLHILLQGEDAPGDRD